MTAAGAAPTSSRRALRWDEVDPFLAGPARPSPGAAVAPFEVPAAPCDGFAVGRLRSGDAWPQGLPGVDRLAAAPRTAAGAGEGAPGDAVLIFETPAGEQRALCVREAGGAVRWSVDPARWLRGLLEEAYVAGWKRPLVSRVPLVNYARAPHAIKALLQRLQSPVAGYASAPMGFPSVPVDDLVEVLRSLCLTLATGAPPAAASPWPEARAAAVTLTHDVDTSWILDPGREGLLREIVETEASLGFRGAWYVTAAQLVPSRHAPALRRIRDAGHEVGAHGWSHDARLQYLSEARQEGRMRRIRARLRELGIETVGMRTPWYCRSEQLYGVLARHVAYDSSVPNASGFFSSRTNSGCCTLFPYRVHDELLELPMTLPPDTALAPATGYERLWSATRAVVGRGGVVVVTLHPQPHQSPNRGGLERYFGFLKRLAGAGERLWHATPLEIVRHYERALGTPSP